MRTEDLLNLNYTIAKDLFKDVELPYQVLSKINEFIIELGNNLDKNNYTKISDNIWISKSATISDKATIIGPCIIDDNTLVRTNAYIRENVIIGKNCVIGNCSEIHNSIIFDNAKIPHFNYVGDSVLGYNSHMGAGTIISNLKLDKSNIIIKSKDIIDTNLSKMGAIIGDNVEIGCNSVINPGTIIGRNSIIYPLISVRGVIEKDSIIKK